MSSMQWSFAAFLALSIGCHGACAEPVPLERALHDVHGAKLYVQIEGRGPPVAFLAGGTLSFEANFAHQRAEFAADRTVIGIEQRSQGHSPDGPWSLSYRSMADDTAALLVALGRGPVDLVGDSDGANVALLVARDHPELVRRVVASAGNLRSGLSVEEVATRHAWPAQRLDTQLREVTASMPPWIRDDYARVSPEGGGHWMAALAKFYFMWIEPEVMTTADLARIQAPVLVLVGDHDFTSIADANEMFRALPHGQLLVVPAAGHGKMTNRPRLVNAAIREFLDAPQDP